MIPPDDEYIFPRIPARRRALSRDLILALAASGDDFVSSGGAPPPPPTNYLLDGSGNVLTDATGNRLLNG